MWVKGLGQEEDLSGIGGQTLVQFLRVKVSYCRKSGKPQDASRVAGGKQPTSPIRGDSR